VSQVTINLQEVISVIQTKHDLYIETAAGNYQEQKKQQHGSAGVKTFKKSLGQKKKSEQNEQ
jgi:hypothetical protein